MNSFSDNTSKLRAKCQSSEALAGWGLSKDEAKKNRDDSEIRTLQELVSACRQTSMCTEPPTM